MYIQRQTLLPISPGAEADVLDCGSDSDTRLLTFGFEIPARRVSSNEIKASSVFICAVFQGNTERVSRFKFSHSKMTHLRRNICTGLETAQMKCLPPCQALPM